jgi:hypothetical protein
MKKLLTALSIIAFFFGFYSCEEDSNSTNLKISLTDAPGEFQEVNIDIMGIEVIINDTKIELETEAGIYNLLDFVNGKDTLLADQPVPPGTISQIRLILGDNNTVKVNDEVFPLTTPSAQQSGLKLNVHENFEPSFAYEYTIDFDAARSIVRTGHNSYILKPVLRVFTEAVSGAIKGIVDPAEAKPVIYAINADNDTITTSADTISGNFAFLGMPADLYDLQFIPDTATAYDTLKIEGVIVNTGEIKDLGTVKLTSQP